MLKAKDAQVFIDQDVGAGDNDSAQETGVSGDGTSNNQGLGSRFIGFGRFRRSKWGSQDRYEVERAANQLIAECSHSGC